MQDSQVLQSDLESLQQWEKFWDIEFNTGKCQVIHITRSKSPVKSRYFMHNQELESVDAAKYLGVTISKDLSWNTHINNITSTANKTLGFVKRNVATKIKISKPWHTTPLSVHRLSMHPPSRALTPKKT